METERKYSQSEATNVEYVNYFTQLHSNVILDAALSDLETGIPDWDYISSTFKADRKDTNIDNRTGYLAEYVAREGLQQYLCAHADSSAEEVVVHVDPLPDTQIQAGEYTYGTDTQSGNKIVLNEFNQTVTEYDGVFIIETVTDTSENDVLVVVLESKLQIPRLPRKRGLQSVKRYVEKKLQPVKTLFNTDKCAFVMTVCNSKKITRNQMRFMKAIKKLGGKITTLGVHRSELEALALSYT